MAGALPDLVDVERLAAEHATLARDYELRTLPRLQDLLAGRAGRLHAEFAFMRCGTGRAGVTVAIAATPELVCQRCMQGFGLPVVAESEVELAPPGAQPASGLLREVFETTQGQVSLRDLAEEELLLALPIAPACSTPATCGRAPEIIGRAQPAPMAQETVRPFGALQDLLKKHDRT